MAATEQKEYKAAEEAAGVASEKDNEKLEHSRGGATTRDDLHDLGVPMLQGAKGAKSEPQGPEDALGEGDKRGDYSNRVGHEGYHPHTAVATPDDEIEAALEKDPAAEIPRTRLVPQRPRASERGEVPGKKGGVDSAE